VSNNVQERLHLLARSPLFRGLSAQALAEAMNIARERHVPRDTFFFHQEEEANTFYLLVQGRARLSQVTPDGHQVVVGYVGPGQGLGIVAALGDVPYPVSAEAVEDCVALVWTGGKMVHLMERHPRVAVNTLRLVVNRFRDLQDRYRELATERVERRVARSLLRLATQTGQKVTEGILIGIPLSRQDLAEMTGTTLYTVSRILSQWEQRGLVATGRERVVICHPHGLVAIAEDLPPDREPKNTPSSLL